MQNQEEKKKLKQPELSRAPARMRFAKAAALECRGAFEMEDASFIAGIRNLIEQRDQTFLCLIQKQGGMAACL